jgi:hypothetical protein
VGRSRCVNRRVRKPSRPTFTPLHPPPPSSPPRQAAKKRGIIDYSAPILLKGAHDKVVITLLKEAEPAEGSKE